AVIWAVPADTAVTSPLLLTVATAAELLCQETVRLNELPSASRGCAVSCLVCPTWRSALVGVRLTLATGVGGGGGVGPDVPSPPQAMIMVETPIGSSRMIRIEDSLSGRVALGYAVLRERPPEIGSSNWQIVLGQDE